MGSGCGSGMRIIGRVVRKRLVQSVFDGFYDSERIAARKAPKSARSTAAGGQQI